MGLDLSPNMIKQAENKNIISNLQLTILKKIQELAFFTTIVIYRHSL